jgi:hypothetical protein
MLDFEVITQMKLYQTCANCFEDIQSSGYENYKNENIYGRIISLIRESIS